MSLKKKITELHTESQKKVNAATLLLNERMSNSGLPFAFQYAGEGYLRARFYHDALLKLIAAAGDGDDNTHRQKVCAFLMKLRSELLDSLAKKRTTLTLATLIEDIEANTYAQFIRDIEIAILNDVREDTNA